MNARKNRLRRRGLLSAALLLIIGTLVSLICNLWVVGSTVGRVYRGGDKLPQNAVGLVLGSSKRTRTGEANPYFHNRIRAAAELYYSGKVKHLLLSGDNADMSYNEPIDMRKALMALGVPDSAITLDYAGFRTLDAIIRCKKIFGQRRITVISQEFHNYRALFIARHYGIDAVAYCAEGVELAQAGIAMREYLARVRAVLDLYVLEAQPRFLGEKIFIPVAQTRYPQTDSTASTQRKPALPPRFR